MVAIPALLTGLWAALLHVEAQQTDKVQQEVSYIWPTAVWNMLLVATKNDGVARLGLPSGSAGDKLLYAKLSEIGESGFMRYKREVMPKEMRVDKQFTEILGGPEDDGTHVNLRFLRWQKRVFADAKRLPVEELNWDGNPVPRHKGINYRWSELYDSTELHVLARRVEAMASQFLRQLADNGRDWKFRTMPWVEVFQPGEFQAPHVHTGAALCGAFFARHAPNSSVLVFDDVRGMSPPFGEQYTHYPEQGELVLFPSWAPHKFTPNQGSANNVYYRFLLWPPGGAHDFDWEDDITGDYVFRKSTNVKRDPSKVKQEGRLPPSEPKHGGEL